MLVFWRFGTFICQVILLLIIVVSHLTGIARGLLFFTLNGILSYCRGGIFFLFEQLPLFLFAIGLDRFMRTGQSKGFVIGEICFLGPGLFDTRFFGSSFLGLHLQRSIVGRTMALETTDIRFPDHGTRSLACFGLRINCSLYHLFKVYGLPVLLLYLDLNKRLEIFPEVADYG